MGFAKANRSAQGDITAVNAENAQRRSADQAERDKADLISGQLDEDTLLRARRFGVRPLGVPLGGPTTDAAGGGTSPQFMRGIVGALKLFSNGR
jgi:hypothetical protein